MLGAKDVTDGVVAVYMAMPHWIITILHADVVVNITVDVYARAYDL